MSGENTKQVPIGRYVHILTTPDGTPIHRPVRLSFSSGGLMALTVAQAEEISSELLEAARLAHELTGGIAPARVDATLHVNGEQESKVTRRAPVQGEYTRDYKKPPGTIDWAEHEAAWRVYDKKWRAQQDAERIAQRGGFGYLELVDLLGREPTTWQPRE